MQRRAFLDRAGTLRILTQCSPIALEELLDCLKLAQTELGDRSVESAYLEDDLFQQLSDHCLRLGGVEPDWCDPGLVSRLLYTEGILLELNRPSAKRKQGEATTSLERYVSSLIGAIALREGIERSLHLCATVPTDRLEAILQAQLDLLKPESKDSTGWQEFIEELESQPGDVLSMGNDFDAMAAAFGFK